LISNINKKAYITTSALSCCAGNNENELFSNICEGTSGIKTDSKYFNNTPAAIGKIQSNLEFFDHLLNKCEEVLLKSNLNDFKNTLLVVGSSVGGINITENIYFKENNYKNIDPNYHNINTIQNILEKKFTFQDGISFSTACTSSANALGYAYEVIEKGIYENVLVIGVDALSQTTVGGFLSLGVLSSMPCKPFDTNRDGMNVSEAIACLLVQSQATDNCVELCGVGYSSDAYHMTHPHPDGLGAISAMENALSCANISKEEIQYINAHGTGTQANDSAEAKAIESLYGNIPYVSSTKSITGHTLGAAGALEAIISKLVLDHQQIPTNTFLEIIENKNINLTTKNIEQNVNYVMSNSFAFGGNNCSLIFGKVQ
jgi:3-oxoacyl-[acyl-carrier-protein] synthase-1